MSESLLYKNDLYLVITLYLGHESLVGEEGAFFFFRKCGGQGSLS